MKFYLVGELLVNYDTEEITEITGLLDTFTLGEVP